jgi:RNA-binding protein 5/10
MRPTKSSETESAKRENSAAAEQQKKKRKIETVAVGRKPAAQLEKWATKRQELKGETAVHVPVAVAVAATATAGEQGVSQFADLNQMCCLLCKRKFQSLEEIQKHERMSKLHKVRSFPSYKFSCRIVLMLD